MSSGQLVVNIACREFVWLRSQARVSVRLIIRRTFQKAALVGSESVAEQKKDN